MKKILSLIIMLFCFHHHSFTQDKHFIDSLQSSFKTARQDTTKANILYELSKVYRYNNPDKAMNYAKQTLALSEKTGYKKGMGRAYNSMGNIKIDKGEYLPALEFHKNALKIREKISDKKEMAESYKNIGTSYIYQGNYPEALKYYLASLKIYETVGDKNGIAASNTGIGVIYKEQGNFPEAIRNFSVALKIYEELGDKNMTAASFNNIGSVFGEQANYPEALKNFLAALTIFEQIGDKSKIASSYLNIGNIYDVQGNYPEALKKYFASLKLLEEIGEKNTIPNSYFDIGITYMKQKKYATASLYLNKALSLSKDMGRVYLMKYCYQNLALLDSMEGNYKQALEHYIQYIIYRDSLVNKENTKKITQEQMQYDFDRKESLIKAEQEKKDAIEQKELLKQKLIRNSFVGGFSVVLLFAVVFFKQRNNISKTKKILEVEKERSEKLLLNILPAEVATELKQTGKCRPKTFSMVTVMFADFKDFTSVSEKVSAELLVSEINYCFSAFDNILHKHKIEKIKTVGDAYMCASGVPILNYTHAFDVVTAALEMKNFILTRKKEKEGKGEIAFEIRIGIHTGPVVAGIVGIKKFSYDIWGDTVNLAARLEQSCDPGKVNISGSTYELVKNKFNCVHRGKIQAKNKGEIDMYFVENIL